jgi:hypothetical protein
MVIAFYPDKPENMDWKDREEYNRVQITKLKLGSTREEARKRKEKKRRKERKEKIENIYMRVQKNRKKR